MFSCLSSFLIFLVWELAQLRLGSLVFDWYDIEASLAGALVFGGMFYRKTFKSPALELTEKVGIRQ